MAALFLLTKNIAHVELIFRTQKSQQFRWLEDSMLSIEKPKRLLELFDDGAEKCYSIIKKAEHFWVIAVVALACFANIAVFVSGYTNAAVHLLNIVPVTFLGVMFWQKRVHDANVQMRLELEKAYADGKEVGILIGKETEQFYQLERVLLVLEQLHKLHSQQPHAEESQEFLTILFNTVDVVRHRGFHHKTYVGVQNPEVLAKFEAFLRSNNLVAIAKERR